MFVLTNCIIHDGIKFIYNHSIIIKNNKILKVCKNKEIDSSIKTIDLNGNFVTPGFIDLQLNGCGGVMFNSDTTPKTIEIMHNTNLITGCTNFLPTFITASEEDLKIAVESVRTYQQSNLNSSLGIHLEGPYLNEKKKGIHNKSFIKPLSKEMVNYIISNKDIIRKITLAPELNSAKFIQKLNDAGIIVSIGHSLATYDEAMNSFKNGVSFATHLFNAMTPLNSREPGIVGAVFSSKEIFAGIIADGFHVSYPNIELAHNILSDKLVLVTDATAAASSKIPSFDFVGTKIYIKNGQCVDSNNTLGGSSLTMIEAIKNCVLNTRIPLSEAIKMATINPAKAIKCEQKFGRIKENRIANLAVFDHSLKMVSTVFEGNMIN